MGQGGLFTPVAGQVTNNRFKVRVMGSAVQGITGNDNHTARINDGAWKKEE